MNTSSDFSEIFSLRRSVRAYRPDPVPQDLLHTVLRLARCAPSGANLQPGALVQVQGAVRTSLSAALVDAWRQGQAEQEDYSYFPSPLPMTLRRRQVAAAQALYGALGVSREDRLGRDAQFARNFAFFDAPVALVVTLPHDFGSGGFMDLGMMLYGLMLAAQSHGLATCAIGAMASYPSLIRTQLGLATDTQIVCGLALGYADTQASVNQTRTTRCALSDYFQVLGEPSAG